MFYIATVLFLINQLSKTPIYLSAVFSQLFSARYIFCFSTCVFRYTGSSNSFDNSIAISSGVFILIVGRSVKWWTWEVMHGIPNVIAYGAEPELPKHSCSLFD